MAGATELERSLWGAKGVKVKAEGGHFIGQEGIDSGGGEGSWAHGILLGHWPGSGILSGKAQRGLLASREGAYFTSSKGSLVSCPVVF